MKNYDFRRTEGFTATELVTVIAVLGAVAYLLLPLIFPGDALSDEEKVEKDLNQLSQILEERERIALLNDSLDRVLIGNLGVFSAYSEITYQVDVDTNAGELNYCLIGKVGNTIAYLDSYIRTVGSSPVGFCLPEGEAPATTEESGDSAVADVVEDEGTASEAGTDATTEEGVAEESNP